VAAGAGADPISAASTIPVMPFPEPETAMASTIGGTYDKTSSASLSCVLRHPGEHLRVFNHLHQYAI